ncbi:MAG TPA: MFS transporter [Candidatus Angelobacter sp.]|jgi:MFS family permease|nr:MFS transporter [Candidatus Angelobacter sp.]
MSTISELQQHEITRRAQSNRRVLFLLSLAELLGMSLWFTGTAVLPQVTGLWHSGIALGSWLTISVQIGFSAGAISFALFNISDVFSPIKVFVISALLAAGANAAFAFVAQDPLTAIIMRGVTGFFLAGVYPVGMKIMAGWFQRGRGLALGIMIGALTIGSAVPHGVNSFGGIAWKTVVLLGSIQAVIGALIVAVGVREGPFAMPKSQLDVSQIFELVRNRRLRLANLGYLGHMWELYGFWGWIAVILAASANWPRTRYEMGAAAAIAIGAIGCIWAGVASDKLQDQSESARVAQRARVTIIAMAASAACCLLAGLVFHQPALLLPLTLIWGIAVIADSAQFSTIISEVSDKSYVGTALTCQVALGFLLTAFSIRALAAIAARFGWQWAMVSMAIGPLLGIWAMTGLLKPQQS